MEKITIPRQLLAELLDNTIELWNLSKMDYQRKNIQKDIDAVKKLLEKGE